MKSKEWRRFPRVTFRRSLGRLQYSPRSDHFGSAMTDSNLAQHLRQASPLVGHRGAGVRKGAARTTAPAISISTIADGVGAAVAGAGALSVATTGTNPTAPSAAGNTSAPLRANLRQV